MKKVNFRIPPSQLSFLLLALMLTFSTTIFGQADPVAGKALFNANCAACHKLDKKATGPALRGVAEKYDTEWLYKWIKNSQGLIKSGDSNLDSNQTQIKCPRRDLGLQRLSLASNQTFEAPQIWPQLWTQFETVFHKHFASDGLNWPPI